MTISEKFSAIFTSYTNIANAIRKKTGGTDKLGLDQMASEINGIPDNDSSDLTVSGATVTVPSGHYKDTASKSVASANQATPSISIDSSGKITASATQSAGYVPEGTKSATKQLTVQAGKTVTPSTSEQTVVPSGRFTTGDVKVAAMPAVAQATPSISIDSSGKITASATQSAGYVAAGTKSATKQMTTKGATTWTPKTSNQSIAAGTYLTGAQTIKGDSNLKAANIKKGVSIFGVSGSCEPMPDFSSLYVNGDQCTLVTNGWSTGGYSAGSSTLKAGVLESNRMSFTGESQTDVLLGTQNAIDLTNASYVKFVGSVTSVDQSKYGLTFCVTKSKNDPKNNFAAETEAATVGSFERFLDVSALTGSYYVVCYAEQSKNCAGYVTGVYVG